MHNHIASIIAEKSWCLADGATGSNFFGRGLSAGYPPDLWCVEKPEEVLWLHGPFLEAGADIILTSSLGANAPRLKLHKAERRVVARSMGPTGELFEPMGTLTHADTEAYFAEQANALAEGGAEVIWIETMSSLEGIAAAADVRRATGVPSAPR